MKVVLLSSANSIHTIQWAKCLKDQGVEVIVVSQHPKSAEFPSDIPVFLLPFSGFLGYFLNIIALKKLLKLLQPQLLNAHYASGYGTTARFVNFHPYVLSVWGSDVFEFPYRSSLHKSLLTKNLDAADQIVSTSYSMLRQTSNYIDLRKKIDVIPFGVDLEKFSPKIKQNSIPSKITIGTVKTLKSVYGIDILLHAYALLINQLRSIHPELLSQINFRIVGGGPDLDKLTVLSKTLNIDSYVTFTGAVPHNQVPDELEKLDIYVALSRQESFGVAVIEAQAMGIPVIVSNVGGLPEVVIHENTGFVVGSENPSEAANAMMKLILDSDLRSQMAYNAEQFVKCHFAWHACASQMKELYVNTIKNFILKANNT